MTTVQQLYPWSYAIKGTDVTTISEESMHEALETMREPHFYTGYSGLLSELGSSSISMRVEGVEMNDVTSRLMITDLAKSMLFQLTTFGFAIVSITRRRFHDNSSEAGESETPKKKPRSEFVATQIRNAEEFTIGFQTHDSRRIYFAKENRARNAGMGNLGAVKRFVRELVEESVSNDEQNTVGRDPNAVFLLAVSRAPSWDGQLMSSASVISPVRRELENRMRTYQAQGYNHAYPLVYLTRQPAAMPPPVKESVGLDQTMQTAIFGIEAEEEMRAEEEKITQGLYSENAMTIVKPKKSTIGRGGSETDQFIRPLGLINSRFQIAQGPNPIAPVFPVDQTESYVDQVSACLAVPRSYIMSNVSKVQTAEEQTIRETKLNAHFLAVSTGLEKALSHARTLAGAWDLETGRETESGIEPVSEPTSEPTSEPGAESNPEPVSELKRKKKKKSMMEIKKIESEESGQRLLVEVKITLALPLERVAYLLTMGYLRYDKGMEMIAQMFGFAVSDLVSEKDMEAKAIKDAKLAAEAKGKPGDTIKEPGKGAETKEPDKKAGTKRKLEDDK